MTDDEKLRAHQEDKLEGASSDPPPTDLRKAMEIKAQVDEEEIKATEYTNKETPKNLYKKVPRNNRNQGVVPEEEEEGSKETSNPPESNDKEKNTEGGSSNKDSHASSKGYLPNQELATF